MYPFGLLQLVAAEAAGPSPTAVRRAALDAKVAAFHKASNDVHGTPRTPRGPTGRRRNRIQEDRRRIVEKTTAAWHHPRKFTPVTTIPEKGRPNPEDLVDRVWDTVTLGYYLPADRAGVGLSMRSAMVVPAE